MVGRRSSRVPHIASRGRRVSGIAVLSQAFAFSAHPLSPPPAKSLRTTPPGCGRRRCRRQFDIDTGSTLRHTVPGPVEGYQDDWFAEVMLPEGAHNREQDWTFTCLNRDEAAAAEGRPFLYMLNVVNTRHDETVRRGAIVKAIAVCSSHQYIEMFRQPLERALDRYYATKDRQVLAELFDALNAANFSTCPDPMSYERALMRRGIAGPTMGSPAEEHTPELWTWRAAVQYDGASIPLSVPLYLTRDEVLPMDVHALTLLVDTFKEDSMRIFNAVLAGQRGAFV